MKLLTLNTHSLLEENYPQKLADFVFAIAKEQPDVIALQEVNQTAGRGAAEDPLPCYFPCVDDAVIREDNHVYRAVKLLADAGVRYHWTWLPVKMGYGIFEEGLALISRSPILETDVLSVSRIDDYNNWKTRKIVGIRTENAPDEWFFSVHYGWWGDPEEPFSAEWEKTNARMGVHIARAHTVWLMGDFNSPAGVRGEGYDLMANTGWQDSYSLAVHKDGGITVDSAIDGWKTKSGLANGMRIDQIWCNRPARVKSSRVIFNGANCPVVSDHYGVIVEYERSSWQP